ncbi:MAG: response regulator [Luteibaculum sp.]
MLDSILVVDDDEVNNFIIEELFREEGFAEKVYIKSSVDEGLKFIEEIEEKPELIILDINMPVKDGFDFLDEYYERKFDRFPSQIILLTSSLFEKDKSLAARYDKVVNFIIKPLDVDSFQEVISQLRSRA